MDDIFNIVDKRIVVTGATGQLGEIICKTLSDRGAMVIGLDKNIEKNLVHHDNVFYKKIDISNSLRIKDLFNDFRSKYKSIDVLINNAGLNTFNSFEDRTDQEFDDVLNINLKAAFFFIKEFSNFQDDKKMRMIINIASVYGMISSDYRLYKNLDWIQTEIYGASKAGLIQLTKYFATHLAFKNIRVNSISPGGIYNDKNPQNSDFIDRYSQLNPLGRMANSQEIMGAIVFLSSNAASYITGHNIVIDGGMSSW